MFKGHGAYLRSRFTSSLTPHSRTIRARIAARIHYVMNYQAVANGPVGPAMAGPIIEPAIYFLFFIFLIFLLYFLAGIMNEPGFFRYYF